MVENGVKEFDLVKNIILIRSSIEIHFDTAFFILSRTRKVDSANSEVISKRFKITLVKDLK